MCDLGPGRGGVTSNVGGSGDHREFGDSAEGCEAFGVQAVVAVGAGEREGACAGVAVHGVVGEG